MTDQYYEKFVAARDMNNLIIWAAITLGFISGFLLAFVIGI